MSKINITNNILIKVHVLCFVEVGWVDFGQVSLVGLCNFEYAHMLVGINLYTFSFAETNLGFACGSMLGLRSGDLTMRYKAKDRQIQAINQ